ncbi:hypothetical protein ACFL6X_00905 [Candidatus Latescibacterota bacterium]
MNRNARSVLRKIGTDFSLERERQQRLEREADETQHRQQQYREENPEEAERPVADSREDAGLAAVPEEDLTESEKRHEQYRRRQAMGGRFSPAAERLPIMTAEEREQRDKDRPKWHATSFEGPIEKLIEKYKDLSEVQRHLSLGQSMKYEFTEDGQVLDRDGNVIYDGHKLVKPSS